MVVTAKRSARVPALILPDEQSWLIWGGSTSELGLLPVFGAGSARLVLLPERLPAPLADLIRSQLRSELTELAIEQRELPLPGSAFDARHGNGDEMSRHGAHSAHSAHSARQ